MSKKFRRPKSLKFHAMALGIICVVITALYFIIVPKEVVPVDPNIATGERFVHIVDATWGQNCNMEINRLRSMGHQTIGEGDHEQPLEPVMPNNAVFALTELCDDKIKCDINAINDTMKLDPLPSCYKELVVGYRCFNVDRKWIRKAEQGTVMTIDCSPDVDQAKASNPQ